MLVLVGFGKYINDNYCIMSLILTEYFLVLAQGQKPD